MFTASPTSILAQLAEFFPSLFLVAPFLPSLVLAFALLAFSRQDSALQASAAPPIPAITMIRRRRRLGLRDHPELMVASLVGGVALLLLAAFRAPPA